MKTLINSHKNIPLMKFEYEGTIIDLYRKTNILKNWMRLYMISSYSAFIGGTISLLSLLSGLIIDIFNDNLANLFFDIGVVLFLISILMLFINYLLEIVMRVKIEEQDIQHFKFEGKTVLGKAKISINSDNVKITVSDVRIIDPDIDAPAYM